MRVTCEYRGAALECPAAADLGALRAGQALGERAPVLPRPSHGRPVAHPDLSTCAIRRRTPVGTGHVAELLGAGPSGPNPRPLRAGDVIATRGRRRSAR